jgi:hypothetical protein
MREERPEFFRLTTIDDTRDLSGIRIALLANETLRIPHGLNPFLGTCFLSNPNPNALTLVVNDERVLRIYRQILEALQVTT